MARHYRLSQGDLAGLLDAGSDDIDDLAPSCAEAMLDYAAQERDTVMRAKANRRASQEPRWPAHH